jgi:hypothetical protein
MALAERALGGLAHDGEGLGKQFVERLAFGEARAGAMSVRSRRPASESFSISGSSALIWGTTGQYFFSFRSFEEPNSLLARVPKDSMGLEPLEKSGSIRGADPPPSLGKRNEKCPRNNAGET